jgi:hypothetical protein
MLKFLFRKRRIDVQVPIQFNGKIEDDSIRKVHAQHNAAASSTSKHSLKQAQLLHSDQEAGPKPTYSGKHKRPAFVAQLKADRPSENLRHTKTSSDMPMIHGQIVLNPSFFPMSAGCKLLCAIAPCSGAQSNGEEMVKAFGPHGVALTSMASS